MKATDIQIGQRVEYRRRPKWGLSKEAEVVETGIEVQGSRYNYVPGSLIRIVGTGDEIKVPNRALVGPWSDHVRKSEIAGINSDARDRFAEAMNIRDERIRLAYNMLAPEVGLREQTSAGRLRFSQEQMVEVIGKALSLATSVEGRGAVNKALQAVNDANADYELTSEEIKADKQAKIELGEVG